MNMLQAKKEELKKQGKKGFTLMELLIVVAIIAVLVAIAIPLFTNQLEKAREATDLANTRSAYAEVMVLALDDSATVSNDAAEITKTDTGITAVVHLQQQVKGWTTDGAETAVAGITATGDPTKGGTATITWTASTNKVTIVYA